MKLLTLNVHSWLEENQEDKLVILAKAIAENDYDVVALQEVNQLIVSETISQQLKKDNFGMLLVQMINEWSDHVYSYVWSQSHIGYDQYEEGIAILTKLPIYDTDAFYCSQSTDINSIAARKVVGLTLSYHNQLIDCYSCHINLPDCKGEDQVENVRSILNRHSAKRLKILLGDFNVDALSQSREYQRLKELPLYDTYDLATVKDDGITATKAIDGWDNHFQDKRLDYVFVNEPCQVNAHRVIFNGKYKPIVSDHYGVEVELVF